MTPHAVGDVYVASKQPVLAAPLQHGCKSGVCQGCVGGRVGQAAERGELQQQRACSGSGSVVALASDDAAPQVEAAVGYACRRHEGLGERLAQLRCFAQEEAVVAAARGLCTAHTQCNNTQHSVTYSGIKPLLSSLAST